MAHGTWESVIEDFLNGPAGSSPNTVRFYRTQLGQLVEWAQDNDREFVEFKAADMRSYIKHRGLSVCQRTQLHDCRCAKHFFKFASKEGYRDADILKDYSVPKPPRAHINKPCEKDIQALLQAIEDRWSPARNDNAKYQTAEYRKFIRARDRALTCFLVETGCRIGEALALTVDMLDVQAKKVTFPKTKTGDPRSIPITDELIFALRPWSAIRQKIAKASTISEFYFITRVGTAMSVTNWGRQWRAYLEFAGMERFTRHSIRHFTIHTMAKVNLRSAQRMAGHKHLNTTELYLHDDPDQVRADHAEAAPLGKVLVNERSAKQARKRVA